MTEIVCPRCATRNRSAAKFCSQCLTQLGDEGSDIEETQWEHPTVLVTRRDEPVTGVTQFPQTRLTSSDGDFLPTATIVEGFRIDRVIGVGGFGVVYLAWDQALERHVAIKEYMPLSLCRRDVSSLEVSVRSERDVNTFDLGLRSFMNEARLLARFDHPALVKVLRVWEGHRTAYMAMPYYEGPTLQAALQAMALPPSESQLRMWLSPLLDALALLHREKCYHRDISPDNILLTPTGPLLLDFGAARRVITDRTQALTTMLKPGFAPIEQYSSLQSQGPWTDLYALGGVVHHAITGRPPLPAVVRVVEDLQPALAKTHVQRYSARFLEAIDATLSVRSEGRPQDVAHFLALLADPGESMPSSAHPQPAPPSPPPEPPLAPSSTKVEDEQVSSSQARLTDAPARRRVAGRGVAALLTVGLCAGLWWNFVRDAVPISAAPPKVVASPTLEARPAAVAVPTPAEISTAPVLGKTPLPLETPATVPRAQRDTQPKPRLRPNFETREAPTSPATPTKQTSRDLPAADRASDAPPERMAASKPGLPTKCSDLLLKASLESLSQEEIAYLRNKCR